MIGKAQLAPLLLMVFLAGWAKAGDWIIMNQNEEMEVFLERMVCPSEEVLELVNEKGYAIGIQVRGEGNDEGCSGLNGEQVRALKSNGVLEKFKESALMVFYRWAGRSCSRPIRRVAHVTTVGEFLWRTTPGGLKVERIGKFLQSAVGRKLFRGRLESMGPEDDLKEIREKIQRHEEELRYLLSMRRRANMLESLAFADDELVLKMDYYEVSKEAARLEADLNAAVIYHEVVRTTVQQKAAAIASEESLGGNAELSDYLKAAYDKLQIAARHEMEAERSLRAFHLAKESIVKTGALTEETERLLHTAFPVSKTKICNYKQVLDRIRQDTLQEVKNVNKELRNLQTRREELAKSNDSLLYGNGEVSMEI